MRSVHTSHTSNFQDMWKWNSARPPTSQKSRQPSCTEIYILGVQWNLDITKGQGTGQLFLAITGFHYEEGFFIYFAITGLKKIVCYTKDLVILRYIILRLHFNHLMRAVDFPPAYMSMTPSLTLIHCRKPMENKTKRCPNPSCSILEILLIVQLKVKMNSAASLGKLLFAFLSLILCLECYYCCHSIFHLLLQLILIL